MRMNLTYASKAVDQILMDKAISRALRAHLFVDVALNTITASKAFHAEAIKCRHKSNKRDDCEDELSEVTVYDDRDRGMLKKGLLSVMGQRSHLLQEAHSLYDELMTSSIATNDASKAENFNLIKYHLHKEREALNDREQPNSVWI